MTQNADPARAVGIENFDCGCCFVVYAYEDHSTGAKVWRRCRAHIDRLEAS